MVKNLFCNKLCCMIKGNRLRVIVRHIHQIQVKIFFIHFDVAVTLKKHDYLSVQHCYTSHIKDTKQTIEQQWTAIYINAGAFMNKYLYENSLLFLYSFSIQPLRLKTIGIEFAFVPNPTSKSLYKVSMNTQCLFMSKFRPSNTKIPPEHHKQNN